jgi:O-antigen ligase
MSTDRIGEYGVILFFWGIASWIGFGKDRVVASKWRSVAVSGFGAVCLLFAQYRTGYVAMAAGILLLLIVRRKWILMTVLAALGTTVVLFGNTIADRLPASRITSFLLRGQSLALASKLSGRDTLWSAAIPIWKHSPIIGNGLETASRVDVLSGLGRGFTSTLHSTWIEALVGTGLIGSALLIAAVVVTGWRAFLMAIRGGRIVPVLVVGVLAIRSVTGTSFEAFSLECMLFLTMAMVVRKPGSRPRPKEGLEGDG